MLAQPPIYRDGEVSGPDKLALVKRHLDSLRADLNDIRLLPHERNAALEQLKIFGRQPIDADPLFTRDGIEVMTRLGFHSTSSSTSKAALQCLVNALLSKTETRQIFVDLGYSPRACARLKSPKNEDEMLISRLLFLTSYNTNQDFGMLIDQHHLAEHINDNLARHAKTASKSRKAAERAHEDRTLSESLKLLFNITHFYPGKVAHFAKSINPILKIITHRDIPPAPLQQPINHLINALLNLEFSDKKGLLALMAVRQELRKAVLRLLHILHRAINHYDASQLDSMVLPLISLLKRLGKSGSPEIRTCLREAIVPPIRGSRQSAANPDALSMQLIGLLTTPVTTALHDAISGLLYELADTDASELNEQFGIGFTSGFVMTRNMQLQIPSLSRSPSSSIPMDERSISSRSAAESGHHSPVNEIVGGRLSTPNSTWSGDDVPIKDSSWLRRDHLESARSLRLVRQGLLSPM